MPPQFQCKHNIDRNSVKQCWWLNKKQDESGSDKHTSLTDLACGLVTKIQKCLSSYGVFRAAKPNYHCRIIIHCHVRVSCLLFLLWACPYILSKGVVQGRSYGTWRHVRAFHSLHDPLLGHTASQPGRIRPSHDWSTLTDVIVIAARSYDQNELKVTQKALANSRSMDSYLHLRRCLVHWCQFYEQILLMMSWKAFYLASHDWVEWWLYAPTMLWLRFMGNV